MRKKKGKIEVALPEEVAEYAPPGESGPVTVTSDTEPEAAKATDDHDTGDGLSALREQLAEAQDKFLRAKAEAQNIARRAQQERAEAVRYGNAELLKALLTVVDDFERTLQAAANTDRIEPVVEGVRLVYEKLIKLLTDNGVEVIEVVGQPFDPVEHAAMMQQSSQAHKPGTVMQEVLRGYRLRDRVLRPAQVIVAKADSDEPTKPDGDEGAKPRSHGATEARRERAEGNKGAGESDGGTEPRP